MKRTTKLRNEEKGDGENRVRKWGDNESEYEWESGESMLRGSRVRKWREKVVSRIFYSFMF